MFLVFEVLFLLVAVKLKLINFVNQPETLC
jgi:hypothetical protein